MSEIKQAPLSNHSPAILILSINRILQNVKGRRPIRVDNETGRGKKGENSRQTGRLDLLAPPVMRSSAELSVIAGRNARRRRTDEDHRK